MAIALSDLNISDEVLRLLPADVDEANFLVNEILEQALLSRNEPSDQKLENRLDWRQGIERGRHASPKAGLSPMKK